MMPDWKPEIRQRLARLQLAPTRENAIVEELAQHLDEYYAELLACGMSEAEAQRQVLTELNENDLLARELRRVERPVAPEPIILGTNRRSNMIADLWQDLRYGARVLLKNRGFTAAAVITLALGISANVTIFSIISDFFFRPLPVKDPDQLVLVLQKSALFKMPHGHSWLDFRDYRERLGVFSEMLAVTMG